MKTDKTLNLRLRIRVSEEDKKNIESRAKSCNLDISKYVRMSAMNTKYTSKTDIKTAYELNKIGVNINQIAKEIHIYRDDKNIEKSLIRLESLLNDIETITKKLL